MVGPNCCRKHWEEKNESHAVAIGNALFNPMFMPFIVCGTCGNKRCPKATDCQLTCTNSNAPGQEGSVY